jgi:hypothetical protein
MNYLVKALITVAAAITTFAAMSGMIYQPAVRAANPYPVSDRFDTLPHRPDIEIAAFDGGNSTTSAASAVQVATGKFHVQVSQVDHAIGVVEARVGIKGDPVHHDEAAWVVTIDYDLRAPGSHELFHKLCVVVDARTGQFQYAYQADPDAAA